EGGRVGDAALRVGARARLAGGLGALVRPGTAIVVRVVEAGAVVAGVVRTRRTVVAVERSARTRAVGAAIFDRARVAVVTRRVVLADPEVADVVRAGVPIVAVVVLLAGDAARGPAAGQTDALVAEVVLGAGVAVLARSRDRRVRAGVGREIAGVRGALVLIVTLEEDRPRTVECARLPDREQRQDQHGKDRAQPDHAQSYTQGRL